MATKPVGDPGSILEHVGKLAAALRARDWAEALRLTLDIIKHVSEPMETHAAMMGAGPAAADSCATALENLASAKGSAGSVPWSQLIPLLLQALALIFGPKADGEQPSPRPAQ